MDINALVIIFLILIIGILISEIEGAILLWILGFVLVAVGWNASAFFGITTDSYGGFGKLLIYPFYILSLMAFLKTYLSWRDINGKRQGWNNG